MFFSFFSRSRIKEVGVIAAVFLGAILSAFYPVRVHAAPGWGMGIECEPHPPWKNDTRVFLDIAIDGLPAGRMVWRMLKSAPRTAENFRHFARGVTIGGRFFHYTNTSFHKILPGFVAQGGSLFGDDTVTETISIYGDVFKNEASTISTCYHTKRGLLSMANVGPGTNGCHFFITFEPAPWLNGRHPVFAEMEEGDEVLNLIEEVGTLGGNPTSDVRIVKSGEILEDGTVVTDPLELPHANMCGDGSKFQGICADPNPNEGNDPVLW